MYSLRKVLIVLFEIITISCALTDKKNLERSVKIEESISSTSSRIFTEKVGSIVTEMFGGISTATKPLSTEQVKGYKTFFVTIPKHGKYVLLSKSSKRPEKLASDIVDEKIADARGTLDEFMMERTEQANEKPQIVKSKKKPIFKKNVIILFDSNK